MNTAEELRQVVGQLKSLMIANMEVGFDFPAITPKGAEYQGEIPSRPNTLDDLRQAIGECKQCKLWQGRTKLVFGEGSSKARILFIGEGPGHEEDISGRPFVGEAGRLLTKIIENGMGIKREEVYICNVIKCRPPNNRDPERDEIDACMPFLRKQIRIINPEVICILGRIAGQELLGKKFKITQDRGKWYNYMDIPVMATFHPAYIVRNPSRERELKGQVWKDIQKIMAKLGLEIKRNA